MDLESVAGELYALHPTRFVQARDARVEEAVQAGEGKLAAQIAALRRPTLSAWASNLLVHAEPAQVRRLLRLGEGLREAHHTLDRTKLGNLNRQQHALVGALSRRARELADETGHPLGYAARQKVEATLHAALADPAAARTWASGRLVRALEPPVGFPAATVADTSARPAAEPAKALGRTAPPKSGRPSAGRAEAARDKRLADERRRQAARARREAEKAEQQARQREEEQRQAEADVEQAEATLRELEERATDLAEQLRATAELRRRVRSDLDRARKRAAQADHTAEQARRAARTARARAERPGK